MRFANFDEKSRNFFFRTWKIRLKTPFFGYFGPILAVFSAKSPFLVGKSIEYSNKKYMSVIGTPIDHLSQKAEENMVFRSLSKLAFFILRPKCWKFDEKIVFFLNLHHSLHFYAIWKIFSSKFINRIPSGSI